MSDYKMLTALMLFLSAGFALDTWNSTCYDTLTWNGFHYATPIYNGTAYAYLDADGTTSVNYKLNCSNNTFLLGYAYNWAGTGAFEQFSTHTYNLTVDTSPAIADLDFNISFYYDFATARNFSINTIATTAFKVYVYFSNGTATFNLLDDTANRTAAFYTNKTICLINTTGTTLSCISVPTGQYTTRIVVSAGTPSSSSWVWYNDTTSTWFFNPTINKVRSNGLTLNVGGSSSTAVSTFQEPAFFYDYTTNKTWYPYAFTGAVSGAITLPDNIIFTDIGAGGVVGTIANGYQAFIISPSSTIVQPKWAIYGTEAINGNSNTTVMYKPYNPATNIVPLFSNIPTYIKGEDGLCYFVPPYSPANLSLTYTMNAYYYECDSGGVISSIPKLPYLLSCGVNNGTYLIQTNLTESATHEVYVIYTNGTGVWYNSTGMGFNYSIGTANLAQLNYTINSRNLCAWNNQSSWFDIPKMIYPSGGETATKTLLALPLMIVTIGLSTTVPYAFAFVFALNDYFEITSMDNIAILGILVGIMTAFSGWFGERNFKTLLAFFVIGATYLIVYYSTAGIDWDYTDDLTSDIETLRLQFENFDLLSIALTLPTFLVNLIFFILTLPLTLFNIILDLLFGINPLMASKFSAFYTAVVVIGYVYIALKGYEIVKNQFRPV